MATGVFLAWVFFFVAAQRQQATAVVINTSARWERNFTAGGASLLVSRRVSDARRLRRRLQHHRHRNSKFRAKRRSSPRELHLLDAARLRLALARPIKWLHIPKCGTSFVNTLAHHRGICPGLDPNMLFVNDDVTSSVQTILDEHPGMYAVHLNTDHTWVRSCARGLLGPRIMSHYGIEDEYEYIRGGHGATMIRQPEQRAISGFLDHHNFCGPDVCSPGGGAQEYAEKTSGCAVKMLTRGGLPCFMNQKEARVEVRDSEVVEALRRLREDFVFVGIAEEWNLSVCLFHAMFGGTCYDFELANVHPSVPGTQSDSLHDTSILNGYTDPYDTPVYEEARKLFFDNIAKFGITTSNCQQMCSEKLSL
eukprot:TRINITY_DN69334_c0_g1_i1.p1 TRINITY_DN69334_c0_g1~~TRINITY_DN69334_c0_g1_i1.p1  ORF type:complete len:385 (-),score=52.12 TRINITY_DN69334_c0_g1_i1:44-1138(-)